MNPIPRTQLSAARRGSVYLAVMGVAMIVSMIGLVTMSIARLQLKSSQNIQAMEESRVLSQSGVEFGLANMASLSDWRTDRSNALEMAPAISIGNGTMTYSLVDEDGNLADDSTDRVRIRGIGRVGDAVYVTSVLLEPAGTGLSSLETSLHSGGNLVLGPGTLIATNQTVSSNGNIDATVPSASIDGDAWAVGNIMGIVTGTASPIQSPSKEMPDPATVFDYYVANGTPISFSSIPSKTISKVVISPGNNPYGSILNPLGVYVIDCQGNDLKIKDTRVYGTLILLNAGAGSKIEKDMHWESAVANFPALMVQGNLEMKWRADQNLRESELDFNFNPAHTAYQGVSDSDTLDEYPGVIKGLIYVSGNLTITKKCNLEGAVVVGGTTSVGKSLTLTYYGSLLNNPPPGFSTGPVVRIVPGTWTRISY